MSLSLKDQLLQAGLITKKQAAEAGRPRHQKARDKSRQATPIDPNAAAARLAAENKKVRDRELARAEQERKAAKARRAQARQLVQEHRLPKVESDSLYNFTDGTRIRRIPVTPELRAQLIAAKLAIVRGDGRYELVPAEIGQRIRERDEHSFVHLAEPEAAPDENDPYKDYKVPDDLFW